MRGILNRLPIILTLIALLTACAVSRTPTTLRLALLAPFEGRYREVGYNALYAVRLALTDVGDDTLELLPIDDGGTVASAADRARALTNDPQVVAALVLGYAATDPTTQGAFSDIPVLVVGHWDARPESDSVFVLAPSDLEARITAPPRIDVIEAAALDAPLVGSDVFALEQFALLRDSLDDIAVVSSAQLPTTEYTERYRSSDPFAPEPGLLAMLSYDAARIAADAIHAAPDRQRASIRAAIARTEYQGLNGAIRFADGYWSNAPVHTYRFDERGHLIAVNNIVE